MNRQDPEHLGSGLGALLADALPFMPSGLRRTGAARLMAERIGERPGWTTRNPIISQLLGAALGVGVYKTTGNLALSAAPLAAVQLDKGMDIRRIRRAYDEKKKRKRLRELAMDDIRRELYGSQELGMQAAYEEMKDRKFKGLGPMAEAADAGMVFSYPLGPLAMGATSFLTNTMDAANAEELDKAGSAIEPSNSPMIATALLGLIGAAGINIYAGKKLHEDLTQIRTTPLERKTWDPLIKHISGKNPLTAYGSQGADAGHMHFPKGMTDAQIISDVDNVAAETDLDKHYLSNPENVKRLGGELKLKLMLRRDPDAVYRLVRQQQGQQVRDNGIIRALGAYNKAPVIAHEAGHAKLHATPGIAGWLQRNMYGRYESLLNPVGAIGSTAAGLGLANPWLGGLAGAGIGALVNAGKVVPEFMASYHGLKGLKSFEGGRLSQPGDTASLLKAYATYLSSTVAPHMLAGAAAGYIGQRRKKKKQEQEDAAIN